MDEPKQPSQPHRHVANGNIRVVLADDHVSLRDGLQSYFQHATVGIEIVGAVGSMVEVIDVCRRVQPDVLLLDLQMPGDISTAEGIPLLREAASGMRIIVLTAHKKPAQVERMLRLGVDGYCDKIEPAYALEQGVREVARGGVWYSSSIQPIIGEIARKGTAIAKLSDLQRYIVWCVAASWSYGRIADQLSFSEQYVREQVSRIYVALDGDLSAHEKAALVTWAREHGLGPDDPSPPPRPT